MDYLAAMRVLVRVVERSSMSAAARDLGIGQPAVSERIERLEAELGTRLLRRNTRAISVTDAGATFYERAKLAIEAADDALSVTGFPLRGTVRLAAPHGLGETLLPPVLLRLRDDHPELRIELVLNDRVVDPVTEGVDLSLRLGDPGEGSFVARRLGHISRLLVGAPAYLDRHGCPERPDELIGHAFARVAGLFPGDRLPLVTAEGPYIAVPINVMLTVSHWRPMHEFILGGGGIGVLQRTACADDLAVGKLVPLLQDFTVPGFELHALYAAGRPANPRVRIVLSLIEQAVSALTDH